MKDENHEKVKEIYKIHGLASAIGRELGVSPQYANMIISGKRASRSEKAARVIKRFNEINSALK